MSFAARYGPWALVAGASEGIGAAFARALAGRGLSLVLAARRPEPLDALAGSLPVETLTVPADLATAEGRAAVLSLDVEIGLVVVNAAYSPAGPFIEADPAQTQRVIDLNCATLVALAHAYLPPMVERRRGGLIVMSSAAGLQGGPSLSVYAASKAFGAVFAEGLWWELRQHGVDVTACVAGAVSTPGLARAARREAPGTVSAEVVAEVALRGLGRGPRVVPGAFMRFSTALMARVLPKRTAIATMARATDRVLS